MVDLRNLLGFRRKLCPARSKSGRQTELGLNTIDAVDGVEVLDASNVEACSGTRARSNRGLCEKVFPNLGYC